MVVASWPQLGGQSTGSSTRAGAPISTRSERQRVVGKPVTIDQSPLSTRASTQLSPHGSSGVSRQGSTRAQSASQAPSTTVASEPNACVIASGSHVDATGAVVEVVVVESVGAIVDVVSPASVVVVDLGAASVVLVDVLLVEDVIDGVAVVLGESISDPSAEQAATKPAKKRQAKPTSARHLVRIGRERSRVGCSHDRSVVAVSPYRYLIRHRGDIWRTRRYGRQMGS